MLGPYQKHLTKASLIAVHVLAITLLTLVHSIILPNHSLIREVQSAPGEIGVTGSGPLSLTPCFITGDPPVSYGCTVTTIAGSGPPNVGDGAAAVQAILENPTDVLAASDGSIYIVDNNNHRVRRVSPDGVIQTVAGTGTADNRQIGDGLPATQAQLRFPRGIAVGADGSLYIADTNYYRIRRIGTNGIITTVAGNGNFEGPNEDILATQASLASPMDVAVDSQGNIYIADGVSNRVRRVGNDGIIRSFAGTGESGNSGDGGPAIQARVNNPMSIAIGQNFLYIGTIAHGPIRRVDLNTGIISTVPGANGSFVATDGAGNLFFSNNRVQRYDVATGAITVVAGNGQYGFSGDGGQAVQATLASPTGLTVDTRGNVYVADSGNNRVRRIRQDGIIETIAGGRTAVESGVPAEQAIIYDSQGLAFDRNSNLFFTDFDHNIIRKLSRDGVVTNVAGNGSSSFGGDGSHPLQASFAVPRFLAFDPRGNLLFIDHNFGGTGVVRLISPGSDGIIDGSADERIMTVAGRPRPREEADHGNADGGLATNAVFVGVRGIAVDSRANLYVADWLDSRVRKVVPGNDGVLNGGSDEIIITVAGNGIAATTGDGGLASQSSVNRPNQIAVDSKNNLYIYGVEDGLIRRVDAATGIITTFARTFDVGGSWSLAFDASDNLYFATGTQLFRINDKTGAKTLIAGTGQRGFSGDGGDARQATFQGAQYITFDRQGNIYLPDNGNFRIRKITFIPSTIQFSAAAYSISEGAANVTVVVNRIGDSSAPASVDIATVDNPAAIACNDSNTIPGVAFARCDYATTVDTLQFAAGETQKSFTIPIIDDTHVEGNETFSLKLSNPMGAILGAQSTAIVTILDNDTGTANTNPIKQSPFFVRQQYIDFLSREPEPDGFNAWVGVLNRCPNVENDPRCDRIEVSASFFRSAEFQFKGYFVYLFYKVSLNRRPRYEEIIPDMRRVTGQTGDEVIAKKRSFTDAWVQRPEFKDAYDKLTNAAFVDALLGRYGVNSITTPDPANLDGIVMVTLVRDALVSALDAQQPPQRLTRAQVLRAIVQSKEVDRAEYNGAFVAMQYYGYLRREPEQGGYDAWLRVINRGDSYRVMVDGFMNSDEYKQRFGPPR